MRNLVGILSIIAGLACLPLTSALARDAAHGSRGARCSVKRAPRGSASHRCRAPRRAASRCAIKRSPSGAASRRCRAIHREDGRFCTFKRVRRGAASRRCQTVGRLVQNRLGHVATAGKQRRPTGLRHHEPVTPNPISTVPGSPPSRGAAGILFDGSFACGCISQALYPVQSSVAGHVAVVPDPMGGGQNVLKFAVADGDRPYAGATNPRADFESPPIFKPGDDDYISIPVLVPITTPAINMWSALAQIYGPPHGGSPTVSFGINDVGENGQNHFAMNQDATYGYKRAWTGPSSNDGRWHTITFHVNFETNNTGFVQIYFDGQLQTLANGSTTLYEATLDPGVNWDGMHANILDIQSYRAAGSVPGTLTTYAGAPKIGTTLASVQ